MQRLIVELNKRKLKIRKHLARKILMSNLRLAESCKRLESMVEEIICVNQKLIFKYINETKILVQCMNSNTLETV